MSRSKRAKGISPFDIGRLLLVLGVAFFLSRGHSVPDAFRAVGGLAWAIVAIFALILVGVFIAKWLFPEPEPAEPRKSSRSKHPLRMRVTAPSPESTWGSARPSSNGSEPPRFTGELLRAMEWRTFEQLVEGYFQAIGYQADRVRAGADGGVDLIVRKRGEARPFALCQCKAWRTYTVGVKPVRELFGVMAAEGVSTGYFVATGDFTNEAREWAKFKPLKLVTGGDLLEKLNHLPEEKRTAIFHEITAGDDTTPTCPACDIKMMRREGKQGGSWGCRNFGRSKCRQTFPIREG